MMPEDPESFRFNSISRRNFNVFRLLPDSMRLLNSSGDVTVQPPPNLRPSNNPKPAYSPAESFIKSIKRDVSLFTTFKYGKFWDNWRRNTLATARAQDVDETFDHQHVPQTDDDKDLFVEKQKFMCSVFTKVKLTNRGKRHAREDEIDFDAQKACQKLAAFCTESTAARVNASDLLTYITSAQIDSWKGTSESFIIHWQDQIRLCHSLVDHRSYFSEEQMKILLENAASTLPSLRVVKDQADQLRANNGEELRCDKYSDLLLSAATNYDNQFTIKSAKTSRRMYNTELLMDHSYSHDNLCCDTEYEVAEDVDYDIDAPTSTLLANLNKN